MVCINARKDQCGIKKSNSLGDTCFIKWLGNSLCSLVINLLNTSPMDVYCVYTVAPLKRNVEPVTHFPKYDC